VSAVSFVGSAWSRLRRRRRARVLPGLVALVAAVVAVAGLAAPRVGAADVQVADAAGCGLESTLRPQLASLLAASDDARVRVELARVDGVAGQSVEVSVGGQAGEGPFARTLTVAGCEAAGQAALLLLSLLPVHERAAPPAPLPSRMPLALSVGPRFDVGSLPGATAGLGAGAQLSFSRLDAWLELRGLVPRRAHHTGSAASARASLYTVGFGLGLPFALGKVRLGPSLGLELGVFRVRGLDLDDARTEHAPWVAALGGGVIEVPLGGAFALRGVLEAAIPFRKPTYGAAEASFATSWPCTVRAALALQWALDPRKTARAATQER
jgi:hypothetical protein